MITLKSLLTEVKITGNTVSNDQSFVNYLKKVEGFKDKAYDDQDPTKVINPGDVVKGVLTIGYGHTGPDVKPGDTITEPAATSKLKQDIIEHFDRAYAYVSGKFPNEIATLDLDQWKMLTDFAFNPGLNKFPKFAEAVVYKNWPNAIKNYKRFFNGSELTQRNSQFYSLFLVDKDTSYKELGKGKDAPANLVGPNGKTLTSVDYCSKLAGAPQFTAQIARIMRFAEYYVEANKKKNGVTLPLNSYIKKYYPELTNIGITPQNWDKPAFCSRG